MRVFSGAVILEGLCVVFDRSRGVITFSESTCGPSVTLGEIHNMAGEQRHLPPRIWQLFFICESLCYLKSPL